MTVLGMDLSSTYGVAFWGFVVSTILFGCIVVQAYLYFSRSRDTLFLKLFVGVMVLLDGVLTLLTGDAINFVLVKNYGNPIALLYMSDTFIAEFFITWAVITASQLFYASRIYIVDKKHWYIPATIAFLAICAQASVDVLFANLFQDHRLMVNLGKRKFVILSGVTSSLASVADIIATVAMCYFLASHRSGFRKTNNIIKTLIFYSVNRGVLVVLAQVAILIVFSIDPNQIWWLPPHLCLSKFHVITLLALLNSRSTMRSRNDAHVVSADTSYTTNNSSEKKAGGILGFGFRRPTNANVVKTLDFPDFASNPMASIGTEVTSKQEQLTRLSDGECSMDTAALDAHGGCSKVSHSMEFADASEVA
ncbi:hypothetical protein SCHPADRAFT_563031 [Schizopora paradoxa]|uniref:DUF6534 domain-containing protein n=1 Tax=Schizopora paradoxa TaxID=27342 RepID=A0A0H2RCD3_9AGAM|nr:hypothetical protein SCHPADRAFT_563031 [Schizopora paradoxa]